MSNTLTAIKVEMRTVTRIHASTTNKSDATIFLKQELE